MATDKKFIVKNGLKSQNVEMVSPSREGSITIEMIDNDTLSFNGSNGQLFSVTDNMEGVIFSVNDISGIPSIEVMDDGTIQLAEYDGNIILGAMVDNGSDKLQVQGSVYISGTVSADTFSGSGSGLTGTAPLRATGTTKADVGLSNVNNTSDVNKPISTATQSALDLKVAIGDIVNGLTSSASNQPLSANQGRILKGYIDNINGLLQSDDTTLDELQEIVNFIKQNRVELDSLGVDNIAGLETALDNKVDKIVGKGLSANDFTNTLKNKLDGIAAGAQVNVPTNLSHSTTTATVNVNSSTGSNTSLPAASTTSAGVMSATDKSKLNGIAAGAQVNVATNLGSSRSSTSYTITSSTGSNTSLASATTTSAGLMSASDKSKLNGVESGAQVNTITSVAGRTGSITLSHTDISGLSDAATTSVSAIRSGTTKANVGLSNVDNTSDAGKPISTATQSALDDKVDKESGKGLSEANFTSAEKTKLLGVEPGAQVNVSTNLGNSRNTTSVTISSSTGSNTSLASATTTNAGVMSASDKSKLDGIESGAQANTVTSVAGRTGSVTLSSGDISGLSDAATTSVSAIRSGTTKANVGLSNVRNVDQVDRSGDTMTGLLTIDNATYKNHLFLKRGTDIAEINPSTGNSSGVSPELRFEGNMAGYWFNGRVKAEDGFYGDGSGLTGIASLRATGTTKGDVGLGNVDNTSDAAKPISTATQSALNTKLNISDVVNNLTTTATNSALSANQGRVLKQYIDNINSALQSDDTTLDELQEIVDFIKLNRAELDALSVGNIAGLETALLNKVDKVSGKELSTNDFTNALKSKLDGIAAGAQVNVGTNLSVGGSGNSRTLVSSTGSNAPLPTATTSNAGLMATGDKSKLDGIAAGAQVNVGTNLSVGGSGNSRTLVSSTGSNAILPIVSTTNAGLMATGDKSKLDGIEAGAEKNVGDVFDSAGDYSGLRARSTTKDDVGLGNLPNATTSSRTSSSTSTLLEAKAMNDHRTSGDHDSRYARLTGATFTGGIVAPEGHFGGASSDGVNSVRIAGGTRTDQLAVGNVEAPDESIETDGNVKVRDEGKLIMGDFAIQYNAATQSLDFNFIGA